MKRGIGLLFAMLCLGDCAGPEADGETAADAVASLAKITTSKGIHYAEARQITKVYFATFRGNVSGCVNEEQAV